MALRRTKKERRLADTPNSVRLFRDDKREINRIVSVEGAMEADLIRQLVSEALRSRRLQAFGSDVTSAAVVRTQKAAMADSMGPLLKELADSRKAIETLSERVLGEIEVAERQRNFIIRLLRYMFVDMVMIRVLQREYVFTSYKKLVELLKKDASKINTVFEDRLASSRHLAEAELDRVTKQTADKIAATLSPILRDTGMLEDSAIT